MEQNGSDQNMSSFCRTGCGFYSNAQFDGMCSKCYKEHLKRRQQSSSPNGLLSPQALAITEARFSEATISERPERPAKQCTESAEVLTPSSEVSDNTLSSVTSCEKSTDLSASAANSSSDLDASSSTASAEITSPDDDDSSSDKGKKPKKNRCHMCKKKIGLTGFECRCGGSYCSVHRYSDKHECTFDYKQLAQDEIRKANPLVQAQKVTKI